MADNPATVQDVADRWRPLTDNEELVAATLLDDAWAVLKHAVPTMATRLDADPVELDVALVRPVLANMVKRVLINPDFLRQQAIQDSSSTFDTSVVTGHLYVTEAELAQIADTAVGAGNAFTIRPYGRAGYSSDECDCP